MSLHACKACIRPSVLQWACAAALAATLGACSSIPRPDEQMQAARAALARTQPVAATEGAVELKLAQGKLDRAERALEAGDNVGARILAEQATVDARYAWTVAESARLQRAAADVDRQVQSLRDDLDRRKK
jgi:Domain of unknown function (DUF4398)